MLRRRWPLLLLLLVPLIPLWRAVFTGQAVGAFDQIRQFSPWNGPAPSTPWDVLQADGVIQFYVWRDLVFGAWGSGSLPFWNPFALAGTPLMANSQSAALYPPHILMGLLHVPTGLAMTILAWAHLAWAGLGTYALIRRLGGTKLGGAVGGMLFSLSPFMITWTGLPSVITTVAWIPWVLASVAAAFLADPMSLTVGSGQIPTDNREALDAAIRLGERQRRYTRSTLSLALSFGMLILGGHLQFVAYGALAAVLLAAGLAVLYRHSVDESQISMFKMGPNDFREEVPRAKAVRSLRWRMPPRSGLIKTILGLVLGAMIAAPQLLAVLNYSQFSHRRGSPTSEGYTAYVASALKPFELAAVPHAPLVGLPTVFADLPEDSGLPPMASYWPIHDKQGANFAESAITIGPLALSLLFLAGWRKRAHTLVPIGIVGLVALLLALGTPLNAVLYYGFPGWSATGSPARVIVLFVLAAAVISGLAIGRLEELPKAGPKRFVPLFLPLVVTLPFALAPMLFPPAKAAPLASSALFDSAPTLLGVIVVTAAALAAAHYRTAAAKGILLASPILLFALSGGLSLVRTGDPGFLKENPLKPVSPMDRVAVVNGPWDLSVAAPALAPPNTPAAARVHDLSGYDSLMHRDTVALMQRVDKQDSAPPANGNMQFVKDTADPAELAEAGVSEVFTRKEMPQLGRPVSQEGGAFRYRLDGPGRASTPQGPAEITQESASSITVKATGPGRLILRDRNMPGWTAKIDGKETPVLGTTWREVDLPEGEHTVLFAYSPPGFSTGLIAASLAILVILAVFLSTRGVTRQKYLDELAKLEAK